MTTQKSMTHSVVTIMKQMVLSAISMPKMMYSKMATNLNAKCNMQNLGWAAPDKNLGYDVG